MLIFRLTTFVRGISVFFCVMFMMVNRLRLKGLHLKNILRTFKFLGYLVSFFDFFLICFFFDLIQFTQFIQEYRNNLQIPYKISEYSQR